jgi:exonuclease III
VTKAIGEAVLGYNPVNDRIMTLRLQAQPVNITIIQIYAPTSAAKEEDKDSFYEELQKTIDGTPNKDVV